MERILSLTHQYEGRGDHFLFPLTPFNLKKRNSNLMVQQTDVMKLHSNEIFFFFICFFWFTAIDLFEFYFLFLYFLSFFSKRKHIQRKDDQTRKRDLCIARRDHELISCPYLLPLSSLCLSLLYSFLCFRIQH